MRWRPTRSANAPSRTTVAAKHRVEIEAANAIVSEFIPRPLPAFGNASDAMTGSTVCTPARMPASQTARFTSFGLFRTSSTLGVIIKAYYSRRLAVLTAEEPQTPQGLEPSMLRWRKILGTCG